MTRSLIDSLIKYYSKNSNSILKVLILFGIKISNDELNIIHISSLDIKLISRVYILNLAIVLFYNLTHIYISLSSYAFCYQPFVFIELFVTSKMSVVSASIDCFNETIKVKKKLYEVFLNK